MEAGKCPKCGKENLSYGAAILDGEYLYFPTSCDTCDWKGKEWYSLKFVEYTD